MMLLNGKAAEEYIARAVLPAMGIGGRPFTATTPEAGTRSTIHLIRAEGMPPLLMRAFEHRAQAVRNAEALRHLEQLGLPAPRLVFHDVWPAQITVETWVEGTRHAALSDPAQAREATLDIASLLARFHAVTRNVWGRPSVSVRARVFSFGSSTQVVARRMVKELSASGWLEAEGTASTLARFASWAERIGEIRSFSLVHNDANRHNFVVAPTGEVTPVDLHRLAYEPFCEELVNALYHFCRKDSVLADRFLERYFQTAGEAAFRQFDATRGFFEPLNYLKKMHRRARTLVGRAGDNDDNDDNDDKMNRWRHLVLSMKAAG
jgi:aminoglycoside phosphotransferase (APT) family kinase protein